MEKSREKKCLAIASINLDIINYIENFPKVGETIFAKKVIKKPGGKGNNLVRMLKKLSVEVTMIGAIGKDGEGKLIKDDLNELGIKTNNIIEFDYSPTGTAYILVSNSGDNLIVVNSGANKCLKFEHINLDLIKVNDFICMNFENDLEIVKKVFNVSKKFGRENFFNYSPCNTIENDILKLIDYIFFNEEEYENFFKLSGFSQKQIFEEWKFKFIIITLGPNGVKIINKNNSKIIKGIKCEKVKDTIGAGDSFMAGFIAGLCKNLTIKECVRIGQLTAINCIQNEGVNITVNSLEELDK